MTEGSEKEPNMIIVGVDYHPSVQQVAFLDTETGETGERRLNHSDGEAERFYRDLQRRQFSVRVGCGLGIRPGSRQHGYGSKRLTGRMPSYCLGCW
jgi:hypothetical protein